jgi:hypothetical protein
MRTPDQIVNEIEKTQEELNRSMSKLAGLKKELADVAKYVADNMAKLGDADAINLPIAKVPPKRPKPSSDVRLKTIKLPQPAATFIDSAFGEA